MQLTSEWRERLLQPGFLEVIIGAITFLAYVSTLGFSFVYDDNGQIVNNPTIASWRYVPDYFTHHFWFGISSSSAYYRPLTLLWSRLNFALFGLNPAGWHFTTVLAHVFVTLLVFRLAVHLLRNRPAAAIAALIFGLHPLHVETASWICAAPDSITAIFIIASFLFFLEFRDHRQLWGLFISLFLFSCALLTKESGIALLPLVFAFELTLGLGSLRLRIRNAVISVLPFAVPVAGYLFARYHAMLQVTAATSQMSMATMWLTMPSVVWFYIEKLFIPVRLSPFYSIGEVTSAGAKAFWIPLISVSAIFAAVAYAARRFRRDSSILTFGVIWMLVCLAPALYIRVFNPAELVQDRYAYIASIGFVVAVTVIFRSLMQELTSCRAVRSALIVFVVLLCFVGTITQQFIWANDVTLFARGFDVAPDNVVATNNAAWSMAVTKHYPEAIALFRRLLDRHPEDARAHRNLGIIYLQVGNVSGAEEELERALQIEPEGEAFFYLGLVHLQLGQFALAERDLRNSATFDPHRKGLHLALATVRSRQNDFAGAVREGEIEATLFPANQQVQALLGEWRTRAGTH